MQKFISDILNNVIIENSAEARKKTLWKIPATCISYSFFVLLLYDDD